MPYSDYGAWLLSRVEALPRDRWPRSVSQDAMLWRDLRRVLNEDGKREAVR
jgi:hypothetical protein